MSLLQNITGGLRGLFRKERAERDLDEELRGYVEAAAEEKIKAGMSRNKALRAARLELGGVEAVKENVRRIGWESVVEEFWQDLRFGARMLRKSPGLAAVVILTLALGVGANTAIFSVVNGFMLRPLPVRAPQHIFLLAAERKSAGLPGFNFSYADLVDFQKQADTFSDLFGYFLDVVGFSADGKADQLALSDVTGNYFSALGINPALGRLIAPDDDQPGKELNMVLGYSFWQKRFGGSPEIIGKQVLVNGKPATIIGVVPKQFRGVYWFLEMDGYVPFTNAPIVEQSTDNWLTTRDARILRVLGRLKSGVSLAQAQSSVDVISRRLAEEYPVTNNGISVRIYPERSARPNPSPNSQALLILSLFLTLAVLVLLLACVNVANILLARATVRRREMAIRAALGSGAGRLIRQMLTETMLLALLAGIGGVLLGQWASGAIGSTRMDQNLPFRMDFGFDWRVFAYSLLMTILAAIIVGVWPAYRASRTNLNTVLHEAGRSDSAGATRHRIKNALVVSQVGSLALLIVAGLFVRSLQSAERMYLGFDPNQVLNLIIDTHSVGYDRPRTTEFYRRLEEAVRTMPGVQSLGTAYSVPMGTYGGGRSVYIEGHPPFPDQGPPSVQFNRIDEFYLETMRIPLLRGRAFTMSDNEAAPLVAIVNQTMAKRFWPSQDPIGKRLSVNSATGPFMEVVGVVGDGKYVFVAEDPQAFFYVPLAQSYGARRVLHLRTSVPPESLILQVQQEVHSLDAGMPISDLETMKQALNGGNGLFIFRMGTSMAGAMGIVGLLLAVIGVYGVVSYGASQRTREIGVRMSLGATAQNIRRLVLRQGVTLVVPGVLAGLILAWGTTRVMKPVLVGVSAADPLTYGAAAILLFGVALLACYLPARRATKVDPMVALRHE